MLKLQHSPIESPFLNLQNQWSEPGSEFFHFDSMWTALSRKSPNYIYEKCYENYKFKKKQLIPINSVSKVGSWPSLDPDVLIDLRIHIKGSSGSGIVCFKLNSSLCEVALYLYMVRAVRVLIHFHVDAHPWVHSAFTYLCVHQLMEAGKKDMLGWEKRRIHVSLRFCMLNISKLLLRVPLNTACFFLLNYLFKYSLHQPPPPPFLGRLPVIL